MLELVIPILVVFPLAVFLILRSRGWKVRTFVILTRAERDASVYASLLRSKKSLLLFPARASGRPKIGVIGLLATIISLVFVSYAAYQAKESEQAQAMLVIPGVTIKTIYGIVGVIVAISYAVIIHETAHAFAGIRKGLEPRATGIVVIGPFLMAYVSFDESAEIDVDVASAGPLSNFTLALLLFLVMIALSKLLAPYATGVLITNGPDGLVGKVVIAVNGKRVHNVSEFLAVRSSIPNGSTVRLTLMDGSTYELVKGSTSIAIANRYFSGMLGFLTAMILAIVFRSYVINFSLGLINALPVIGLDGSKVIYAYLKRLLKNENVVFRILMGLSAYAIVALLMMLAPRRRSLPGFSSPPLDTSL